MGNVGPRIPKLNTYAVRRVQSAKQEYLDHFSVFGDAHLRCRESE